MQWSGVWSVWKPRGDGVGGHPFSRVQMEAEEGGRAEKNPLGSSLRTEDHASRLAAAERRLEAQAEQIATMLDGAQQPEPQPEPQQRPQALKPAGAGPTDSRIPKGSRRNKTSSPDKLPLIANSTDMDRGGAVPPPAGGGSVRISSSRDSSWRSTRRCAPPLCDQTPR